MGFVKKLIFSVIARLAVAKSWQSISAQADSKQNAHKAEALESTFSKVDSRIKAKM